MTECLPGVRAQVHRRLLEAVRGSTHAGDGVVVDRHYAERGVRHHDGEQPELDPDRLEGGGKGDARHDPRQGNGQDDEEADGLTTEEPEPMHRERRQRPQHQRHQRRPGSGLDR